MRRWLALATLISIAVSRCAPLPGSVEGVQLRAGVRSNLDPNRWLTTQAAINWPPNHGVAGMPMPEVLPPGTLIDRFGSDDGNFFSPVGTSYSKRALPYVCLQQAYTVYRVISPLPVWVGHTAPWFDQPGDATQFETDSSAARMIRDAVIVPIKRDAPGLEAPDRPCEPSTN